MAIKQHKCCVIHISAKYRNFLALVGHPYGMEEAMNREVAGLAIVTGAASGIGRATAVRLRADGFAVIAVDINENELSKIDGVRTLVADLSKEADRDRVIAAGNGAQVLVNAAGYMRMKKILDFTVQDIRDIYAVNVDAVWDLTSRIGRTMPRGGSIVNLSSVSAKMGSTQETAVYASSKAAVISLTRSFAYAFGPAGVRVNAICPGIVDTPMQENVLLKLAELRSTNISEIILKRLAGIPLGRTSTPEEVAAFISFLASEDGSYFTGQALSQDGGMVMS